MIRDHGRAETAPVNLRNRVFHASDSEENVCQGEGRNEIDRNKECADFQDREKPSGKQKKKISTPRYSDRRFPLPLEKGKAGLWGRRTKNDGANSSTGRNCPKRRQKPHQQTENKDLHLSRKKAKLPKPIGQGGDATLRKVR